MSKPSTSDDNSNQDKPTVFINPAGDGFNFSPGITIFKRYVVKQRLGKGGMGEVYLVSDIMIEQDVVLKLLLPNLMEEDAKSVERFVREARISCKLRHPHIVTVYDIGIEDSIYYLKMEYISGCNLRDWMMQQQKPIPLLPILTYGKQLADAVAYAHHIGVIHRDIKPRNIMITDDNQVKLLDFGIARLKAYKDVTSLGVIIGTMDYMPPERYQDPEKADTRTDIYSLGAVLFELLVGRIPIGRFELPGRYRPEVPSTLDIIIDKSINNNPDERYQTANELGEAIQKVIDSLNPVELPTPLLQQLPTSPDPGLVKRAQKQADSKAKQGNIDAALAIWEIFRKERLTLQQNELATDEVNRLQKLKTSVDELKLKARQLEEHKKIDEAWHTWHSILELTPQDPVVRDHIDRLTLLKDKLPSTPISTPPPGSQRHNKLFFVLAMLFLVLSSGLLWMVWKNSTVHREAATQQNPTPLITTWTATPVQKQAGYLAPTTNAKQMGTVSPTRTAIPTVSSSHTVTQLPTITQTSAATATMTPSITVSVTCTSTMTPTSTQTLQPTPSPTQKPELPNTLVATSINYPMVKIPTGIFTMGSPQTEPDRENVENQHDVQISKPFYLGVTEVSQAQWKEIMGSCNARFKGDDLPVESVSWYEVVGFCNKLSQREGLTLCYRISGTSVDWDRSANGYRLPTEAEWEYACRAGTTSPFNTGNNLTKNQANYNGNYPYTTNPKGDHRGETVSVTSFNTNDWGLKNMHGNVWEWCWDWYADYPSELEENPVGPSTGFGRVLRGGGWRNFAYRCRSAIRVEGNPVYPSDNLGFRLARSGLPGF